MHNLDHKLPTLPYLSASDVLSECRAVKIGSPSVPTDAKYSKMLKGVAEDSDALLRRLANGELTPREWADEFKVLLNDGHTKSWVMGRWLAGDLGDITDDDRLIGIAYGDTQADFLLGFMEDLEGGRYLDDEGKYILSQIQTRANMYVSLMRGTSGAAFVAKSDSQEEFNWTLGGAEEHCNDCPDLAAENPWLSDEIYAFPGDGNTACLSNCKCHLVRVSDGRTSFKPVTL